jgi:chemotaxis protein MotB
LLFDSGEATLKPGGVDVLRRIGGVLKQYPDRTVHIAGHTDNFPIRDALARTFPTNMELSQARADSAKQASIEGGMTSDNIEALGHADSRARRQQFDRRGPPEKPARRDRCEAAGSMSCCIYVREALN